MTNAQARAHIERYALSPRHRTVALALLESQDWDERDGTSWLCLANNVITALDRDRCPVALVGGTTGTVWRCVMDKDHPTGRPHMLADGMTFGTEDL